MENWDDIWRRNQFLCAGLARRNPQTQILFVGLPRDYTHAIRARDFSCFVQTATYKVPEFPNITVTHPPKLLPNTFVPGRLINEAVFRLHVKAAAKRLGMQHPLLWLNPHSAVHMIGKTGECGAVYDVTDDWTTLTQQPWLTSLICEQDRALCRLADAVIVCSERLAELKTPLTRSLHLVPNGVDAAHYQAAYDASLPLPEEAKRWQHPVFGYTGTIHPDRVDLALIESLAGELPEATVVLIGPVLLEAPQRQRLEALPNVFLLGAKPYADLPRYMQAFDVCMTPHLVTPFTESLNPIKLWEYLATGKPIVSTAVAGFRDYPQLVHIAQNHGQFIAQCREALQESAELAAKRIAEAQLHSWDKRVSAVQGILEGLTP